MEIEILFDDDMPILFYYQLFVHLSVDEDPIPLIIDQTIHLSVDEDQIILLDEQFILLFLDDIIMLLVVDHIVSWEVNMHKHYITIVLCEIQQIVHLLLPTKEVLL